MTPPIIRAECISIWYDKLQALKSVSLDIPKNQITAFIGASGSGKSSFLRSMNRMLDVLPNVTTAGSMLFKGNNVFSGETDVIRLRRAIGLVFQNPTPFPKSIFDNVAFGLEIQGIRKRRKSGWWKFWGKYPTGKDFENSHDAVDKTVVKSLKDASLWEEVKDRLHISAFQLSGGQQQRLCIARAIAVKPEILLLDEPCSALDPISTRKIEELLLELKKHYTIVIVTHNLHQARRISDHVGFFHLGELIELGPTKKIFESPDKQLTREYIRGEFG